ncbi:MAG: beta-propeller fold lactonase family protein [Verrucomicrobia bacterium]|nr:beta-propeller fold lactonase family protein [Verrucomicrobiota bacterium]
MNWKLCFLAVAWGVAGTLGARVEVRSFYNWETAPVHPVALSPDGSTLAVCNLPDNRVELFRTDSETVLPIGSIPVGLDPVSVRFYSDTELWVVNRISDSISIVYLPGRRVVATLQTANEPADVVFAGSPLRAFVSCSDANEVAVFDPVSRKLTSTIPIEGEEPRALAVSPDGKNVYAAIFESGNASTVLAPPFTELDRFPVGNPADFPLGPHGGINPPPNSGEFLTPEISSQTAAVAPPPRVGLIVKKNESGKWMDDNDGDWSNYVSGESAYLTGRRPGWDLLDNDVAVIDTKTLRTKYVRGLMNICADIAVDPGSGNIAVIGTDAMNHVRFEPALNGVFIRAQLAVFDPGTNNISIKDLNPHLDYTRSIVPDSARLQSLGDPRAVLWDSTGSRVFVTGMGSNNLLVFDSEGNRVGEPIRVGEGPDGLALDEPRKQLYVFNRFESSISVVNTSNNKVVRTVRFFDPTPEPIKSGRRHFYSTHKTSGSGHVSCASCHIDARTDRLAWDLGNPAGTIVPTDETTHNFGRFPPEVPGRFHPMKGPMVTQTLQDIIGHEPFHWRGDRDGIEAFNETFMALQGAEAELTRREMSEFKAFLSSVAFPPNPYRNPDNSLSTNLALPGHTALGRGALPTGAPLPRGNARAGLEKFRNVDSKGCIVCHTLPSGLGPDRFFNGVLWSELFLGPNDAHHIALISLNRSDQLPFKIQHLRDLHKKVGTTFSKVSNGMGFGFLHDGSVDTLVRFLQDGFGFESDEETANMIAFLLSITGSDLPEGTLFDRDRAPGVPSLDVSASVGKQLTLPESESSPFLTSFISLANSPTGRVELVAKAFIDGRQRGWLFDRDSHQFVSDRSGETASIISLRKLAQIGNEITFTLVPEGSGRRIGIDRDEDGFPDSTELDGESDPASKGSVPGNTAPILQRLDPIMLPDSEALQITVIANDPDVPAQSLRFSLGSNAPSGAAVDPFTGELIWTPNRQQRPGVFTIIVQANDDGTPPLTNSVPVMVTALDSSFEARVTRLSTGVIIRWDSQPGKAYRVQFKDSLDSLAWQNMGEEIHGTGSSPVQRDSILPSQPQRIYRVLLVE